MIINLIKLIKKIIRYSVTDKAKKFTNKSLQNDELLLLKKLEYVKSL